MPTGLAHSKSGASGSAYVTYRRPQEAQRCVETVDGVTWAGESSLHSACLHSLMIRVAVAWRLAAASSAGASTEHISLWFEDKFKAKAEASRLL